MSQRAQKFEVQIEEVKDAVPSPDRDAVVLETEAVVDGKRGDTSIEVPHEDLSTVAVALLAAEDGPPDEDDSDLPQAVQCLGAGVVQPSTPGAVRFHLQFDSGQVLPIEMSREAALALCRGLLAHTASAA